VSAACFHGACFHAGCNSDFGDGLRIHGLFKLQRNASFHRQGMYVFIFANLSKTRRAVQRFALAHTTGSRSRSNPAIGNADGSTSGET
jgi:hypothetical protein